MNEPAATDLPEETRRRIDAMYERLELLDHYTILGIPRTATRPQIRSAFLAMAPQFHPDRFFGRKLGVYAGKMQRVFAHLSEAHDTLLNQELRATYDKTLPPPLPGAATAPRPPIDPPSAPPPPKTTAPPPPTTAAPPSPPAPLSPEASRARQQAFASRLAGQGGRLRTSTPVAAFRPGDARPSEHHRAAAPSSPVIPPPDTKAAAEALRRRYEESLAHARGRQTTQAMQAAEAATKKGDFVEAARQYRLAFEQNPDPSIRAALMETEAKAKEQTYTTAVERARTAEQKSEFE
ncbi:MAG TPA: J domain-containing protein, partial [Polyangiaceae bacterium]